MPDDPSTCMVLSGIVLLINVKAVWQLFPVPLLFLIGAMSMRTDLPALRLKQRETPPTEAWTVWTLHPNIGHE